MLKWDFGFLKDEWQGSSCESQETINELHKEDDERGSAMKMISAAARRTIFCLGPTNFISSYFLFWFPSFSFFFLNWFSVISSLVEAAAVMRPHQPFNNTGSPHTALFACALSIATPLENPKVSALRGHPRPCVHDPFSLPPAHLATTLPSVAVALFASPPLLPLPLLSQQSGNSYYWCRALLLQQGRSLYWCFAL